jgi:hypothetical protein
MGSSTARMRCPVPSDVSIVNLQSHMHARGFSFSANVVDPARGTPVIMYETTKWIEPPVQSFDPFLMLHEGQMIETRCDYASHEARTIGYGPHSTDEMCQLIGPYFPRDERLEACADAFGKYAAEWIGQGFSDGVTTRSCLECAPEVGGYEYTACIVDACPAISAQVSAVVRCELAHGAGACVTQMEALSQASCSD